MSRVRILGAFVMTRWCRRFRSRAALNRYQRRRLAFHLAFLRKNSPWFRSAPRDLETLPLMSKQTMMENFDALNTVGIRQKEAMTLALRAERTKDFTAVIHTPNAGAVAVGLSSGTSGHRGIFITSEAERDRWAGTMLARTLPSGRILGHRIALFLRADNALYETVASKAIAFRYFDVAGDIVANRQSLLEYAPTILVAPPSVLRALAEEPLLIRPERVYSVAEVLEDADAQMIASAYGQTVVHQLYQCTEGFLAHTCDHGVLHLNEDLVQIEREYLDDRRFLPIVTDFSRTSQPIVRYRLNDILIDRQDRCPCGSVLAALERIEGRQDDALIIDGRTIFADLVTRAMVYAEGVDDYRVVQIGPMAIEVQLTREDPATLANVRRELDALWARSGVAAPEIGFGSYVRDPTRKLRRVERRGKDTEG